MRVTCPNCQSKFKVPNKALGDKGRKVRCGSCQHQWFQTPPAPKAGPEADAVPAADAPLEEQAAPADPPEDAEAPGDSEEFDPPPLRGLTRERGFRPRDKPARRVPMALLVLLGIAVAIPAALFAARESLVHAWPASALLYQTVGLPVPVPGEGLVLQNVYVQHRLEGTVTLLVVNGEIRNPSDRQRSIPAIQGTVLDAEGRQLQSWLFQPDPALLLPKDTVRFTSEFAGPAAGAAKVHVTFSDQRPEAGIGY